MTMELAYSADDPRALFQIIRSGEARLAVALAVIEGDDPDPDGGYEPLLDELLRPVLRGRRRWRRDHSSVKLALTARDHTRSRASLS